MAWPDGDAQPVSAEPSRRYRDLTTRVVAGVMLAALAIAAILLGPFGVLVLTGVALGGVAAEWRRITGRGLPMSVAVGGGLYLALSAFSFCYIYFGPDFSSSVELARNDLFWFVAVVVANDCCAYGVGRLIGGPRLAPRISPKKTWSGTSGGLAGACAVGALAAWGFGAANPILLALAGLILGILAQVGDLAESWIKRQVGVKDAGHIIPGHGGLLDRFDGMAAAAIGLAAMQAITGTVALEWA